MDYRSASASNDEEKDRVLRQFLNNNVASLERLTPSASYSREVAALHAASAFGQEQIVDLLLPRNIPIDSTNHIGWTPLMQAARNGHFSVVLKLLKHGADVSRTNRYGSTVLLLAVASNDERTINAVINTAGIKYNLEPLFTPISVISVASLLDNPTIMKQLLDLNFKSNSESQSGVTPLMIASALGYFTSVKLLLNYPDNPMVFNCLHHSARDIAVSTGHNNIAQLLDCYEHFQTHPRDPVVQKQQSRPQYLSRNSNRSNNNAYLMSGSLLNSLPVTISPRQYFPSKQRSTVTQLETSLPNRNFEVEPNFNLTPRSSSNQTKWSNGLDTVQNISKETMSQFLPVKIPSIYIQNESPRNMRGSETKSRKPCSEENGSKYDSSIKKTLSFSSPNRSPSPYTLPLKESPSPSLKGQWSRFCTKLTKLNSPKYSFSPQPRAQDTSAKVLPQSSTITTLEELLQWLSLSAYSQIFLKQELT